ncbi:MAG TPA: hypothetical protein VF121_03235 [Thermoanaerobaculia bacterium]|nr:hypothetical protein [Thermoanaerobaculia bacterium]
MNVPPTPGEALRASIDVALEPAASSAVLVEELAVHPARVGIRFETGAAGAG